MPRMQFHRAAMLSATLALAGLAGLTVTGCGDAPPSDTHPQQLVTKRQAVFKDFARTLEPLGLVARDRKPYNPSEFMAGALELQRLSTLPWAFFTADGNYPPTRARPEVWQTPADFRQAQEDFAVRVGELVQAAQGGQLEAVRPAVLAVQDSCKACHDRFRTTLPGR